MPTFINLLNGLFFQVMEPFLANTIDDLLIRLKLDDRAESDTTEHILNLLGTIHENDLRLATHLPAGRDDVRNTLSLKLHQFRGIEDNLLNPLPLVTD